MLSGTPAQLQRWMMTKKCSSHCGHTQTGCEQLFCRPSSSQQWTHSCSVTSASMSCAAASVPCAHAACASVVPSAGSSVNATLPDCRAHCTELYLLFVPTYYLFLFTMFTCIQCLFLLNCDESVLITQRKRPCMKCSWSNLLLHFNRRCFSFCGCWMELSRSKVLKSVHTGRHLLQHLCTQCRRSQRLPNSRNVCGNFHLHPSRTRSHGRRCQELYRLVPPPCQWD